MFQEKPSWKRMASTIYKKEQDEYVLSPIETGFTDGENMEIISGLDKDETYYIAGVH